jgi:O-antigen/teichoic acid export membrane protein
MLAATGVLALNVVLDVVLIPRMGLRGALVASAVSDLTLHLVCAAAAWLQYRDLMIDRRSVALLLAALAALPTALAAGAQQVTLGLVAAVLVLAGALVGITGDEWESLARHVVARMPGRIARAT